MSFTVSFYNYAKKPNSTARPTGAGTGYDCILKDGSSIRNPTIILQAGLAAAPLFNYCYIAEYGRYYYVDNWTWTDHRLWAADLSTDVLATFKTEIGNSNLYVVRSAAASNPDLIDTYYPAETDSQFSAVSAVSPFTLNVQSGTFVIGVSSGDTPTYGTCTYYAVDSANMIALMRSLNSDFVSLANNFSAADASLELQKALINPFKYINSCIWFPVDYGDMPAVSSVSAINVGGIDMTANGSKIFANSPLMNFTLSWALPDHPQIARGRFMNNAYRKLFLQIPPFGAVELDPSIACNYSKVIAEIAIDATTGQAAVRIGCGNNTTIETLITRYECPAGVEMQLSTNYRDSFNALSAGVTGLLNTAAGLISGNVIGAAVSAVSGITSATNSMRPHLESVGGQGSFASYAGTCTLYVQFVILADEDLTHAGRPLCENRTISGLAGYNKVLDGDIDIPGFGAEADEIKNYLEAGFFYE